MILIQARVEYTKGKLTVTVPVSWETAVEVFAAKVNRATDGRAIVKLQEIRRHRTTGWKSQNHHINGHVQAISNETGQDFTTVKTYCKMEAVARGYPFDTMQDTIIPWSESRIDTIQAAFLIDAIHQVADEMGIILQEE